MNGSDGIAFVLLKLTQDQQVLRLQGSIGYAGISPSISAL